MPQFNLNWFNTAVIISPNALFQRALYRQKSIGGSFISIGFTPSNDLPKTASATISPNLAANVIWQFEVEAICTVGGPTINENGVQEKIAFACLTPSLSQTATTATIVLNITGLDITKARFILHKDSDDSVVSGPTIVNPSGSAISLNVTGLTAETVYYWEVELYSTTNGVEVISSTLDQLGSSCQSMTFETDEDVCNPITSLNVSSIEL